MSEPNKNARCNCNFLGYMHTPQCAAMQPSNRVIINDETGTEIGATTTLKTFDNPGSDPRNMIGSKL